MYGINRVGADGQLLTLIGSQNTDSGGNSMAPASMMNPAARPTKVDRASDVTGLVDTGELGTLFTQPGRCDRGARIHDAPVARQDRLRAQTQARRRRHEADVRKLVRCGYLKSTYLADRFRTPSALNPDLDPHIVAQAAQPAGITPIFTAAEYNADGEFRKAAAIMKMVINGYAGAGTVTMGGYDYHGQGRNTGETRNFRAGRCIGACLEYAARMGKPLMIYVFSDGALSANGVVEHDRRRPRQARLGERQPVDRRVVRARLQARRGRTPAFRSPTRMQIGSFSAGGSVVTTSAPAANAVNLLVETVILNYMALHGEEGNFPTLFPSHGLGSTHAARQPHDDRADLSTERSATRSKRRSSSRSIARERRHRCRVLPTLPCLFCTVRCVAISAIRASQTAARFVDIVKWAMGWFRASDCVESGIACPVFPYFEPTVTASLLVRTKAALQARFAAFALGCVLSWAACAAVAAEKYELLGQPAPDLVARGLSGENVRLSEHRGEVVVVSFWSGSCNTCRAQLEALDRIAKTYASAGLTVHRRQPRRQRRARREVRARAGRAVPVAGGHRQDHRARLPGRPPADDRVRGSRGCAARGAPRIQGP